MDWLKQLTREQTMTFVIGFVLECLFMLALAVAMAAAPLPQNWSTAGWVAFITVPLGAAGFHTAAVILMASHRAVEAIEHRVTAALASIDGKVKDAIAAELARVRGDAAGSVASIKAELQGKLDLAVRDERVAASDRANADAAQRLSAHQAAIRSDVQAWTQETQALRAAYDRAVAHHERTQAAFSAVIRGLREAGWQIEHDVSGQVIKDIHPPKSP